MGTCQSQTSHSTFSVVCIVNTVVFPRSQLFVCTMSHFAFPIVLTGSMPLQAFCHWQFYKDTFDTSSESVKENDVSQDEKDETASNDVDTNDDASGWNTAPTRLPRRCSLSVAFDRVNQRTNSSGVQCAPVSVHLSTYDFNIRNEEVSMLCVRASTGSVAGESECSNTTDSGSRDAAKKKKGRKTVSWAEESCIRQFFYFEMDETERGREARPAHRSASHTSHFTDSSGLECVICTCTSSLRSTLTHVKMIGLFFSWPCGHLVALTCIQMLFLTFFSDYSKIQKWQLLHYHSCVHNFWWHKNYK